MATTTHDQESRREADIEAGRRIAAHEMIRNGILAAPSAATERARRLELADECEASQSWRRYHAAWHALSERLDDDVGQDLLREFDQATMDIVADEQSRVLDRLVIAVVDTSSFPQLMELRATRRTSLAIDECDHRFHEESGNEILRIHAEQPWPN
jgi:hypothetical protein